jgi:hypothetical protein
MLLSWMEPLDPATATITNAHHAMLQAKHAAAVDPDVSPRRWDFIILAPPIAPGSHASRDLSSSLPHSSHFRVSPHGVIRPAWSWRRQQPCSSHANAMVIVLEGLGLDGDVSLAQWIALRTLLFELSDGFRSPNGRIELDSSPAGFSARARQSLGELLAVEGFQVH